MTTFLPLGIDAAGQQRGKANGAAGLDHQLQFAIGKRHRLADFFIGDARRLGQAACC